MLCSPAVCGLREVRAVQDSGLAETPGEAANIRGVSVQQGESLYSKVSLCTARWVDDGRLSIHNLVQRGRSVNTDSLPFCDYLYSLETECLPLYSPSCSPPKVRQVVAGAWLRQELQRSLTVFPRDQYFSCNTTHNMIHHTELAAMREMIRGVSKNKKQKKEFLIEIRGESMI